MIEIRHEKPEDYAAVYRLHEEAFGQAGEAELVERLRRVEPHLSLVAVETGEIIGHIFFSPVTLAPDDEDFHAAGLAPMAVLPARQNQGIGSALVRRGLEECRKLGFEAVFVLGHAQYYPRFGFIPARSKGFDCEYEVPDDVFMALELKPGALNGFSGTVKYRPEFAGV